jgi:iron-sulfur cluster insertion protein
MINVTPSAATKINELLVDPISARYLRGAEVDFVDNITGGGFTIKNPNAKSTCGCGSSFSV